MKLGRTDKQDTPLIPVTFSGRAVVWRLLADPIWASGHAAALTGRTHERFRPAVSLLPRPLNPRGRPHMVLLGWEPTSPRVKAPSFQHSCKAISLSHTRQVDWTMQASIVCH